MFGNIRLHRIAVPREHTDIKPLTIPPIFKQPVCTAPYQEIKSHLQHNSWIGVF